MRVKVYFIVSQTVVEDKPDAKDGLQIEVMKAKTEVRTLLELFHKGGKDAAYPTLCERRAGIERNAVKFAIRI